jgi:hypothetical protein
VSCIILVWGICRSIKFYKSVADQMVNKVMIIMHIVAYLAIIMMYALAYFTVNHGLRAYEIYSIFLLAVYSVCTLIFGLIVN